MSDLVLIAESDPFDLRLLEELCEERGFDVVTAGEGEMALNVVARQRPAMIVLDARLTTDDGSTVLDVLAADPSLSTIPILLTLEGDAEAPAGVADVLTRPYKVHEVERRVQALLRLSAAEEKARSASDAPPAAADGGADPWTHAGGANQLRISLEYESTRAVRYGHPLTCAVLRVTNLDAIGDASGADAAQGAMVQLANDVRRLVRGIDHVFRPAPGELVVLLPETSSKNAKIVLDRLRGEARSGGLAATAVVPAPELSLGAATLRSSESKGSDGEALLARARRSVSPL